MKVDLIPSFTDNYLFVIARENRALVIDPGSAPEVLDYLRENGLILTHILVTHHHADHIGGVEALVRATGANLSGPSSLASYGLKADRVLHEGEHFAFEGYEFEVLAVPGHTLDHLAYSCVADKVLFCGDTLFSLGCGRLFEGSFEQMHASLKRLRALPAETKVYCAHEYTLTNARFSLQYLEAANAVEPVLAEYRELLNKISAERAAGRATVPSTLEFEEHYNLFLKARTLEEFTNVRQARNQF